MEINMNFRSLRFLMTLSVLLINIASSALTMCMIMLLGRWRLFHFLLFPQAALVSSIVIGTTLSAIVYHRFFKPIDRLIRLTERVKEGDYSVRVDSEHAVGNIATLIHSFNGMTEQLSSVEMLKSDFIGTFSHEFKTPIVSIRGFAKQLRRPDLTEQERTEYIDIIIHESERLTTMSTNVLLLSRFENEQTIGECKEFLLDEQIRTCILMLEKSWDSKNIVLDLALEETPMYSNPSVLEHIWINLLTNAVKFSPEGGEVHVSCYAEGEDAVIVVRDRGEGMTEQTASRIFEKFYQGDTSHSCAGNGLGLSIVKRIVELADGQITVNSEVGKGATFRVILPRGTDRSRSFAQKHEYDKDKKNR